MPMLLAIDQPVSVNAFPRQRLRRVLTRATYVRTTVSAG